METRKRRLGDRKDGYWLRDADPLHAFTPYLMPNRADNEAFINEKIDLTAVLEYLDKKNEGLTERKYTIFHIVAAALIKTVTLRPKMNRFVQGNRLYQRNQLTLAFVVKKRMNDEAREALAFKAFDEDTTIDSFHKKIMEEIYECRRDDALDNSTKGMAFFSKIPRWLLRIVMKILRTLDYYGRMPDSLIKTDPDYASVYISNLGSIKLNAAYHHLNNWGTNSLFIVIGEKHMSPFYNDDGTYEMRPAINLGITLDERIADGYYYSKTIKLLKHLLENPELLELPAKEKVDYE